MDIMTLQKGKHGHKFVYVFANGYFNLPFPTSSIFKYTLDLVVRWKYYLHAIEKNKDNDCNWCSELTTDFINLYIKCFHNI